MWVLRTQPEVHLSFIKFVRRIFFAGWLENRGGEGFGKVIVAEGNEGQAKSFSHIHRAQLAGNV